VRVGFDSPTFHADGQGAKMIGIQPTHIPLREVTDDDGTKSQEIDFVKLRETLLRGDSIERRDAESDYNRGGRNF
jgi:hypothetical protein